MKKNNNCNGKKKSRRCRGSRNSTSSAQSRSPTKKSTKTTTRNEVPELSEAEQAQFLAMDCEMVGVGPDGLRSALARVVLMDWNGQVVLDQYVRPSEPVTDYRTYVSGITAAHLQPNDNDNDNSNSGLKAVVDLETCRQQVLQVLQYNDISDGGSGSGKIVVGHALKNDFMVLGIRYPWYLIRDTAKWEPFMKTRTNHPDDTVLWPRKLQELCHDKLQRDIQQPGQAHCPKEDALAALDLYKLVRNKWEKAMVYKINKTNQIALQQQQQQQNLQQQQKQEICLEQPTNPSLSLSLLQQEQEHAKASPQLVR